MLARIEYLFFALFVVLVFTADARSQGGVAPDRVVVSYPSKSITSFPILETAQRRGFFRGLSPERDFILLNMGGTPERYAALKSGTLAASMLSAPHSLRAEKEGFTKIAATRDYVDVPGTALVAHADKIKKQPEMIKRFLRATLRAMNYIRENRADAMQMITREFGMAPDIAALAYDKLGELLSVNGKVRVDGYQLLIDFARAAQKVERPIPAAQLVDERLLDEVVRETGIKR